MFTFNASAAYLTDEIAFLIGPTKDGVIKEHQLSPIPLHDNPFAPLSNDKDNEVTFCVDDIQTSITDHNNKKKVNKRKKTKNQPSHKTTNLDCDDIDFSDEDFPVTLFNIGGEQMKNDYVIRKREREFSPDSDSSLEIHYKALRTYPPEIDESNAESVERTRLIEI